MVVVLFRKDKEVYTFSTGITPKINIIAQLEFELTMMLQSSMLAITQ